VAAIDPAGLLTHYRKILRESRIEIFYVGSAPAEAVAEYISPLVSRLGGREGLLPPQTPFHPCPGQDVTETMEVSQGKLCMGFVTPIVNRDKEFPAMQVFNTVFGAGMTSKLFLNVREKLSLCYYASSNYVRSKGILTVSSGIESADYQRALDEILHQLQEVRDGHWEPWELEGARSTMRSALASLPDSQGALENYCLGQAATGQSEDPETMQRLLDQVTPERIRAAAQSVTLDTVYFLHGKEDA